MPTNGQKHADERVPVADSGKNTRLGDELEIGERQKALYRNLP